MIVKRQTLPFRTVHWMNAKLRQPMPDQTNLCKFFWSMIISITIFPVLWLMWKIISFPFVLIVSVAKRVRWPRVKVAIEIPEMPVRPRETSMPILRAEPVQKSEINYLPGDVGKELCLMMDEYARKLRLILLCGYTFTLAIMLIIDQVPGLKLTMGPWIVFSFFCMMIGVLLTVVLQLGTVSSYSVTGKSFAFRHRKAIRRFNQRIDSFGAPFYLAWEFLKAKKAKICPIIIFED